MKGIILAVVLSVIACTPALAGLQSTQRTPSSKFKPITIYNHSNIHIAYVMNGRFGGPTFYVPPKSAAAYYTNVGDDYAVFQVGVCNASQGANCTSPSSISTCSGSGHYNGGLIKEIHINSLSTCVPVCTDGSTTSCRQDG